MNNKEGRDIAERTSRKFLQARISQNVRIYNNRCYTRKISLGKENIVPAVENMREKVYQDMTKKCKDRQKKKFEILLSRKVQYVKEQYKRLVHHLSRMS